MLKFPLKVLTLTLPLTFLNTQVMAGDLKPMFTFPSSQVLPKGVRNVNLKGVMVDADSKLNSSGNQEALANPFFKDVTFQTIIDGASDGADRAGIINKMQAIGASEDDKFGETRGQVNISAIVNAPVIAYGLSDKHTVGMAIPVTKASVNIDSSINNTDQALFDQFAQELINAGYIQKASEFYEKMSDPIAAKLKDDGYQPLENEESTKLGDIKLVSKYQFVKSKKNGLSLVSEVTLPTGEQADVDKVVDVAGGDGQTDLGLGLQYDYSLNDVVKLSAGTTYTVQLADKTEKRIPEEQDSSLSSDVDDQTKRNLGDIASAQVATSFYYKGIKFATAYGLQYKSADKYSGDKYEANRYEWMSQNTVQNMQTAQALIGYDTMTLFRQGRFKVPLSVSLTHTRVLKGKNVVSNPMTTLDLAIFF